MVIFSYIALVIVGLITGGITSLVGASAVTLIVPALTMLFHTDAHVAIGTSLLVDIITSIIVAYNYHKQGHVRLKSGLWMALAAIVGAQFGSLVANRMHGGTLFGLFGVLMIYSGISGLRKKNQNKKRKEIQFSSKWIQILCEILIGIGIGIMSGIFGAGGGVMILMALVFILHYPMHIAVGTSTLIMAITACSSDLGYMIHGNINFIYGAILSIGAVIGGFVGSKYANKINDAMLSKFLNWFFIIVGVIMLIQQLLKYI